MSYSQTTGSGRGLPHSQGHAPGLPGPAPSEGAPFDRDGDRGLAGMGSGGGGETHIISVPSPGISCSQRLSQSLKPRESLEVIRPPFL